MKVKEAEEAKRVFKRLFEFKRIKFGSNYYSSRIYLSFLNDKLEQHARDMVLNEAISLK